MIKPFLALFAVTMILVGCSDSNTEDSIRKELQANPVLQVVEELYPDKFAEITSTSATMRTNNANTSEVDAYLEEAVAQLRLANSHYISKAPQTELLALIESHQNTMLALKKREGVEACAQFAYKGGYSPDLSSWDIKAEIQITAINTLRAIAAGRDNPQSYGAFQTSDGALMVDGLMDTGLTEAEVQEFFAEQSGHKACKITVALAGFLLTAEGDAADRLRVAIVQTITGATS